MTFVLIVSVTADGQVLTARDHQVDPNGMPNERIRERNIEIGRGVTLRAVVEETAKGNGTLLVGNLRLKIVDEHDDGAVYAGVMPHVEFADFDGDGYRDLVVSGVVEYTDEKGKEILDCESFVFLYRYDVQSKGFKMTFKRASFDLTQGPRGTR